MGDPQADIWVFALPRGSRTRLTFGGATHLTPSWSADGERVVFERQTGATIMTGTSLRARLANGGGQEEILIEVDPSGPAHSRLSPQWAPQGRHLAPIVHNSPT